MPKASITAFYWWLVPNIFRNMRVMLWITTIYISASVIVSILVEIFICFPVQNNWSLDYDKQGQSAWNSWPDFIIQWSLTFSGDVLRMLPYSRVLVSLILTQHSLSHPLLYHEESQTASKTEVRVNWCILARLDHNGHQLRSLHDLCSIGL
jgi:hypothetical protein